MRWSSWLGWQIESNWTEPWLFAVYVIVKPLASSLMLVCMFYAARFATQGAVPVEFLPYVYVSNACYFLVGAVTFGMSWTVISDREHYGMLKYIYVSPARFQPFFLGRGLARAAQAFLGVLINLSVGLLVFSEIRSAVLREPIEWGWLLVHVTLGTIMLGALGMIITGILLNMARHGMFLSEGVAGVMYLVCGVIFPVSVLPIWLQGVSLALPPTYWLEGMRRSLMGSASQAEALRSPLSDWTQAELAGALLVSTAVLLLVSQWVYRWSVRRAWRLGRFEQKTGV